MCNINRIHAFILAAFVAALVALVILAIVAVTSSNFWTSLASPGFMIAVSISLALAIYLFGTAASELGPCGVGRCESASDNLRNSIFVLIVSFGALLTAVIIGTLGSAVPGAGTIVAVALAIFLTLLLVGEVALLINLVALRTCLAAPPAPAALFFTTVLGILLVGTLGYLADKTITCIFFC